jgi:RNAse (barnase) inhibitor barstar
MMPAVRTVIVDCAGVRSETEFWERYLRLTDAEGAGYFGRNLDAFWDALNGGPGWPGECELLFTNAACLAEFRDGRFLEGLQRIADESDLVRVVLP